MLQGSRIYFVLNHRSKGIEPTSKAAKPNLSMLAKLARLPNRFAFDLGYYTKSMGSRVALKRVALLIGTPKLRSAEGMPIIFLLLSGSRSGTQCFAICLEECYSWTDQRKLLRIIKKRKKWVD